MVPLTDYNFLGTSLHNSYVFHRLDRPWHNAKKLFWQKSSWISGQKISQAKKLQLESFLSLDIDKCICFWKCFHLQNEVLRELQRFPANPNFTLPWLQQLCDGVRPSLRVARHLHRQIELYLLFPFCPLHFRVYNNGDNTLSDEYNDNHRCNSIIDGTRIFWLWQSKVFQKLAKIPCNNLCFHILCNAWGIIRGPHSFHVPF